MTLDEFVKKLDVRKDRDEWRYIQKKDKDGKVICLVEHKMGVRMEELSWEKIWERVSSSGGGTR